MGWVIGMPYPRFHKRGYASSPALTSGGLGFKPRFQKRGYGFFLALTRGGLRVKCQTLRPCWLVNFAWFLGGGDDWSGQFR
jgi:hypothetical protein